jgi:hypothetical protein
MRAQAALFDAVSAKHAAIAAGARRQHIATIAQGASAAGSSSMASRMGGRG